MVMLRTVGLRLALALRALTAGVPSAQAQAQPLAGGNGHTLVLKSDGTVWAFGLNSKGQLGASTTQRKTPVQVTALSSVVAVAAGAYHSKALTSGDTLYVWGNNSQGQVGDNMTTRRTSPVTRAINGTANTENWTFDALGLAGGLTRPVLVAVAEWAREKARRAANHFVAAAQTYQCTCAIHDDWCSPYPTSPDRYCVDPPTGCLVTQFGCGWFFTQPCTGVCTV